MKACRVRQLKNRQSPYTHVTLYVIEGRDKYWEWRPSKSIEGNVIVWDTKRSADEWILLQSSQKHIGKGFLIKAEQRYRVRKVQMFPSIAKGTFVSEGSDGKELK